MKTKLPQLFFYLLIGLMPIIGFSQIDSGAIDITVECDGAGNTADINAWLADNGGAVASSTCGNVTWTNDYTSINNDTCYSVTTVIFTATGDCGSATTTATFIIDDIIPPTASNPAAITVNCIDDIPPPDITIVDDAADNCSSVIVSFYSQSSDGQSCPEIITRTYFIEDDCANTSFVTQTIMVGDTISPTINIPASDISVVCDGAGNVDDLNAWLTSSGGATASDNCNNYSWENNFTSLSSDCSETVSTTVTFTVFDDCYNIDSTTATFTIVVSNDECIYAYPLILGETLEANNESATTSALTPSCNDVNRADVWFMFNSATYSTVDITVSDGYNMQLWEGDDCNSLTHVPNACGFQVLEDIAVSTNTNYYLQVWSEDTGRLATGLFDVLVQDGALSTESFELKDIILYPNPTQSKLYITGVNESAFIEVYNIFGQAIKTINSNSNQNSIDFSNLKAGVYFVTVNITNFKQTFKVVKQ